MGLLRGIRDLWRQYRSFGDTELEQIRQQVLKNRETLLQVKAIQEANAKVAEEQMLKTLRSTVEEMRSIHDQADSDSKAAQISLGDLGMKIEREMARDEKRRTVELLQSVDVAKILQDAVDGKGGESVGGRDGSVEGSNQPAGKSRQ